jgi:hypothetical protein
MSKIYIFGDGKEHLSLIYDATMLTEQQKSEAVQVDRLPEKPAQRDGFDTVLRVNKEENEVYWEEVAHTREQILQQELSDALDLLIEGGIL